MEVWGAALGLFDAACCSNGNSGSRRPCDSLESKFFSVSLPLYGPFLCRPAERGRSLRALVEVALFKARVAADQRVSRVEHFVLKWWEIVTLLSFEVKPLCGSESRESRDPRAPAERSSDVAALSLFGNIHCCLVISSPDDRKQTCWYINCTG